MNFSIKLGYHFSWSKLSSWRDINDNYIKILLKGGGATTDRRMRRLRLITEILKTMDFHCGGQRDVMDAVVSKFRQPDIENKTGR